MLERMGHGEVFQDDCEETSFDFAAYKGFGVGAKGKSSGICAGNVE